LLWGHGMTHKKAPRLDRLAHFRSLGHDELAAVTGGGEGEITTDTTSTSSEKLASGKGGFKGLLAKG